MILKPTAILCAALLAALLLPSCTSNGPITRTIAANSSAQKIESNSRTALNLLYSTKPKARELGRKAEGVLIFPKITKAGLMVGGQVGQGTLFLANGKVGYYQTTAASYGLQAGAQTFGYALFLMDKNALQQLYNSAGWEVGGSPSLVVVDEGMATSLTTSTIQNGTYAVFFNQKGLMAGLGLQGTKITQIDPRR